MIATASRERTGINVRKDSAAFMGVVRAISSEVEKEQRLDRGTLLGTTYIHCRRLLDRYDASKCSTFAHYAFLHVKPSLTRDVTRERRAAIGLKHDGTERATRTPPPDHHEAKLPEEMPPWWPMLSPRQKSIVLLTAEGVKSGKIAYYVGIEEDEVLAELSAVRSTLRNNRVPLCDVPESLDETDHQTENPDAHDHDHDLLPDDHDDDE